VKVFARAREKRGVSGGKRGKEEMALLGPLVVFHSVYSRERRKEKSLFL